jgi:hypothetical protein
MAGAIAAGWCWGLMVSFAAFGCASTTRDSQPEPTASAGSGGAGASNDSPVAGKAGAGDVSGGTGASSDPPVAGEAGGGASGNPPCAYQFESRATDCEDNMVCSYPSLGVACECRSGKWWCTYELCPTDGPAFGGYLWDSTPCAPETQMPDGCACASSIPYGQSTEYCKCEQSP